MKKVIIPKVARRSSGAINAATIVHKIQKPAAAANGNAAKAAPKPSPEWSMVDKGRGKSAPPHVLRLKTIRPALKMTAGRIVEWCGVVRF